MQRATITRKAYPSDITDAEWEIISPLLPQAQPVGRPRQVDLREIISRKKREVYGYDSGKKAKGRKRFILIDTLGLLLAVIVTEANFPERLGGAVVVMEAAEVTENLSLIWVNQGFSCEKFARVIHSLIGAKVEVVCRTEPGFQVLPKRWIVERTFAGVEPIPPLE